MRFTWKKPASPRIDVTRAGTARRSRRMEFSWDHLEERKVMSHGGGLHELHAVAHVASTSTMSSGSNATLSTARQTLQTDIRAILAASGTTVAELSTLHSAFQALASNGLTPTSGSALSAFENGLVTTLASGTTLNGNTTLQSQFAALYTSTPTAAQTTALDAAYNALAAAVTSANITSANITTISNDFNAVLQAASTTSTATFPYFSLVLGQVGKEGFGGHGGEGDCGLGGSSTGSGSNATLSTARQTLQTDIRAILAASGTTVAELSTLHSAFQALASNGLTPTSGSALSAFENGLVTTLASGTTLNGNTTLQSQFAALYTSSPTAAQTTALDAAYNALAAAVTSANITSANITTISNDFNAVLQAASSTSTATFPYFSLVLGQVGNEGFGGFGGPGMDGPRMGGGRH